MTDMTDMTGYRIVIVDDDAFSMTNARTLLAANGIKASCLRSGRDFLKFMEKNTADLVLLDILMPEMDGFATLRAMRELEEKKGSSPTPVIFLTGENDSEAELRGLGEGASDFIRKPFNSDVLMSRIRNTVENKKTISTLTVEATLDKLTGFLNKAGGTKKTEAMCRSESGALVVFDLDNFKLVNDLYGHDMGDRVLEAFAAVVRSNCKEKDVVSRIGGDEFMGFFVAMDREDPVAMMVGRLNGQLLGECKKLMGKDFDVPIGVSAGVVFVPEHGREYDSLFKLADSCMYLAKQNGRHGYEIYDPVYIMSPEDNDLNREISRVTRLVEERNEGQGAQILGQESFASNYRFIRRFVERYQCEAYKLLFSLIPESKDCDLAAAAEVFSKVLKAALRRSDIIMRSRANEFFLVLMELTEQDLEHVIGRIMKTWEKEELSASVRIEYASEVIISEKTE